MSLSILLNAFDYPLSTDLIKKNFKEIMGNIFIFDEDSPKVSISLAEMDEKLH